MNDASAVALVLAAGLVLLGALTGYYQLRGLRALAARRLVPSDEYGYFRNRYRRRRVPAAVLVTLGGLIGGASVSGMMRRADELGEPRQLAADADPADKPKMTDAEKRFFRFWTVYWALILVLVFLLVGLAMVDALATRRYWLTLYRQIREEHQSKLRRDLAVYKQHREQTRGGRFGNRLGGPDSE